MNTISSSPAEIKQIKPAAESRNEFSFVKKTDIPNVVVSAIIIT